MNGKTIISISICAILLICSGSGCGYKFRATGEGIGVDFKSLAIPLVTSTSSDIGFESAFTRILREEFIDNAKVPLMSKGKAQIVLIGHINSISTDVLSVDLTKTTIRGNETTYSVTNNRRLRLNLDIRLLDRESGRTLWHDNTMQDEAPFSVGDDPLLNRHNQEEALQKIAGRLSKRIYLKTMERF